MDSGKSRGIPRRVRSFDKATNDKPLWLRLLLGRDPSPSRQEYDALAEALWEGDAAMDGLLDWMYSSNLAGARRQFEQALEQGITSVPDAPEPLRAFFREVDETPDWVDWHQIEIAWRFIHRCGLAGPFILRDLALMGGYLLSGFNQALVLTGALNKGPSQRINETGKWWLDCTGPDGLRRHGNGFKTTIRVRMVHALVRRNLQKRDEWDNQQWGVPINQTDMAATYLAFCVVMMVGMRALGIPITPTESRAVMHLWKYAAWLMGVDLRWLKDSERDGLVLLYQTYITQSRPDWTSKELGSALANEPLTRRYRWRNKHPVLHRLLLKGLYHQHLSTTSLFLNADQRQALGLPGNIYPWYPLLTAVPRFLRYASGSLTAARRAKLEKRGRAAQVWAVGEMKKQGGGIIQPPEDHPAFMSSS